jgi:hypothetical protein
MKKLLNILGVISVVASTSASVIACGGGSSKNDNQNLSDLQKQMIESAELMSKIVIAGRHENLNYNVNEVLSSYMTPLASLANMPQTYNYNGAQIDIKSAINTYKTMLAPNLGTFDKDNYSGFYASYLMGMYSDDFYNGFIDAENNNDGINYFSDSMNEAGDIGVNKTTDDNAMGYANGLNADLKLSDDVNRRELAWGIQDTGAYTNYLLDKGYDGANPASTSGTGNPSGVADETAAKGGTNAAGYLYYNSVTARSSSKYDEGKVKGASLNNKFGNTGYTLEDQSKQAGFAAKTSYNNAILNTPDGTENFGETGAYLAKAAGNYSLNGFATSYAGYLNLISKSQSGAEILTQMMDLFLPILQDTGSSNSQDVAQNLITRVIDAFWKETKSSSDAATLTEGAADALTELDSNIAWSDKFGDVRHMKSNPLPTVTYPAGTLASHYFYQNESDGDFGTKASDFFTQLIKSYDNASNEAKQQFANSLFGDDGIISKATSQIFSALSGGSKDLLTKIVGEDGSKGISLLNVIGRSSEAMEQFADTFDKVTEKFNNTPYKKLSTSQRLEMSTMLGWNGSTFTKGSFFEHAFETLKGEGRGTAEFNGMLQAIVDSSSDALIEPHEKVLQYIYGDKAWSDKDLSMSTPEGKQKNSKMSFTLDYTGVGDTTSTADQQTTKIEDKYLDNFNPYQTKLEYQKDKLSEDALSKLDENRISGEVLGKKALNMSEEQIKSYDGSGMLENMKPVHHYYKVEWTNVSNHEDKPYWVISSIHSFNDKNEEFYNIY